MMTEKIVQDFFNKANHHKIKLNITGSGDPFASIVFRNFLENLDGALFPNLSIDLQTNGVLFTERTWERMSKIQKNIHSVFVSLDAATEATYNLVRRGGHWEKVNENIRFLSELRKKGDIERLQIHFVVQKSNYKEMIEFAQKYNKNGIDLVYFSLVDDWGVWSKEVFLEQAVWKKSNSEFLDFLDTLSHPIFEKPKVFIGNLTGLRNEAVVYKSRQLSLFKRLTYLLIIYGNRIFYALKKKAYLQKLKLKSYFATQVHA